MTDQKGLALILFAFLILSPLCQTCLLADAQANTYYVDINSGSDSYDGSKVSPWKTLHGAFSKLNSIQPSPYTLIVLPGVYSQENGEVDSPLILNAPNGSIICAEPKQCTITNSFTGTTYWNPGIQVNASYITISGLNITGFKEGVIIGESSSNYTASNVTIKDSFIKSKNTLLSYCIWALPTSNNLQIINNKIEIEGDFGTAVFIEGHAKLISENSIQILTDTADGIWYSSTVSSDDVEIIKNKISGLSADKLEFGIYYSGLSIPIIANNVFKDLLYGLHSESKIKFVFNTLVNNEWGAYLISQEESTIENNIFYQNNIGIETIWQNLVNFNCFYANATDYTGNVTTGSDNIFQDPKFLPDTIYELSPQSPCIDSGGGESSGFISDDIHGTPRPQRGLHDIGAFEYINQAPTISSVTVYQLNSPEDTFSVGLIVSDAESDHLTITSVSVSPAQQEDWMPVTPNPLLTFKPTGENYSITFSIKLPELPSGEYKMKVKVEDEWGDSGTKISAPFLLDNDVCVDLIYSPSIPTSGPVTATVIQCEGEVIQVLNNNGKPYYVFQDNGEFTFKVMDSFSNYKEITATVDWIDKISPSKPIITTNEGKPFFTGAEIALLEGNADPDVITITINGQLADLSPTGIWQYTATLNPGKNTFVIVGYDLAGNLSEPQNFIVTKVTPGTYYLDEKFGVDDFDKGTGPQGQAFKSLNYAIEALNAGSPGQYTLVMSPGLYSIDIPITRSDLTIIASQRGDTVIEGSPLSPALQIGEPGKVVQNVTVRDINFQGESIYVLIQYSNNVVIQKCLLTGGPTIHVLNSQNVLIMNNFISSKVSNEASILAENSLLTIKSNTIHKTSGHTIKAFLSTCNIIRNNLYSSNLNAIMLDSDNSYIYVDGNLIYRFGEVFIGSSPSAVIKSNTFVNNNILFGFDDGSKIDEFKYNIVAYNQKIHVPINSDYNCYWDNLEMDVQFGNKDIQEDPQFLSDTDFSLLPSSPCKAATDRIEQGFDIYGNQRPQGTPWSMGAIEYKPCAQTPSNLRAWWKGEGNYLDSAADNDGLTAKNVAFVPGKVGLAFRFEGIGSSISVPGHIVTKQERYFSIGAWVYPFDLSESKDVFRAGKGSGEFRLGVKNGDYVFGVRLSDENWYEVKHPGVASKWTHLVGIRDNTTIQLWLDGVKVGETQVQDLDLYTSNEYLSTSYIGFDGGAANWYGMIDELQIYNKALTQNEIQGIFSANNVGLCYTYTCVNAPNGVQSWWKGEGNANDVLGNKNGTISGGVEFKKGKVGEAFSFNGIDSYVNLGNVDLSNKSFSISLWAKRTSQDTTEFLVGHGELQEYKGMVIGFDNYNKALFGFPYSDYLASENNAFDLNWHHWVFTYNNTTKDRAIYKDGMVVASDKSISSYMGSGPLLLGIKPWQQTLGWPDESPFKGFIDEIVLFGRDLTPQEVLDIYKAGPEGICIGSLPPPTTTTTTTTITTTTTTIPGSGKPQFLNLTPKPYAMVGRQYNLEFQITDDLTPCNQLDLVSSMGEKLLSNCAVKIQWIPLEKDVGDEISLDLSLSDTNGNTSSETFKVKVLPELKVTPSNILLLRLDGAEISKTFVLMGGKAEQGYNVSVFTTTGEKVSEVSVPKNPEGKAIFTFESQGKEQGDYIVKIEDEAGFYEHVMVHLKDVTTTLLTLNQINLSLGGVVEITSPISAYYGSKIVIPAGAGTKEVTLTVKEIPTGILPIPEGLPNGGIIQITAEDQSGKVSFDKEIEVTLPYSKITNIQFPENLRVYVFDENMVKWVPLHILTLDKAAQTITFKVDHFSYFAVIESKGFETTVKGGTEVKDYMMLALPSQPDAPSIKSILTTNLGAYDDTMWRLFSWDYKTQDYIEANAQGADEYFLNTSGRAFWLISRENKPIVFTGLPIKEFQGILKPGWNMLGNPFSYILNPDNYDFIVSTDLITWHDDLSGFLEPYIWIFQPEYDTVKNEWKWYKKVDMESVALSPYQGCWIYSNYPSTLYIKLVPKTQLTVANKLLRLANSGLRAIYRKTLSLAFADSSSNLSPPAPPIKLGTSPKSLATSPGSAGGGGCFIATAAYGSEMERSVVLLKELRDRYLITTPLGAFLVKAYYKYSPPIAKFIEGNSTLKGLVRISLIPAVMLSYISLRFGSLVAIMLILIAFSLILALPSRLKRRGKY